MKNYLSLNRIFVFLSVLIISNTFANAQNTNVIPAGTKIRVKMDNEISSKFSSVNDTFTVTISEPVVVHQIEMVPIGTIIEGKIVNIKMAGIGKVNGNLDVTFKSLRLQNDAPRLIDGSLTKKNFFENSRSSFNAISIFSGIVLGSVIGGVAGKGRGALIGASIGAGTCVMLTQARKGKDAAIKANEEFEIRLNRDLALPIKDY